MKESLDADIDARKAEPKPISLLPPDGTRSKRLRWLDRKYRIHLFLVFVVVPIAMAAIYLDHQQTTRQQIAMVRYLRCVHALKSRRVDSSLLSLMNIKSPPPKDMNDLEHSVKLCQVWREQLQLVQPTGDWTKALVTSIIKENNIESLLEGVTP